jgi:predicted negative regulator of RcsB-dependent stress response
MVKWGHKNKQGGAGQAAQEKPGRASNKLDYVLVAQSKQNSKLSLGKLKRHKRAGIVALAVVLVLAGGAYAAWRFNQKNAAEQQAKDFQTLVTSVKDLRNQGKDGEAQVQLSQFNDKYPDQTQEQRYRVASELAAIYRTSGNTKNALKWQQTALDNNSNPGYSDYIALGEAYTQNRENAQAIKYLQLALDAVKGVDNSADGGPRGRLIQHQIDLLKGQGQ